jgi:ribonuclease P protein component
LIGRISDRRTFEQLARAGRSSRTRVLWCRYLSDPAATPVRVAFAVGRSYGRATERNRLRRRLRAIVADEAVRCDVSSGWLLIGARPNAKEHTFDELRSDVRQLLMAVSSAS